VRFGLPSLTRKPQTNLLPCLTDLLPLADSNGDDQVRLRETDEFRRACVVTGCDTRSTDVIENHLTCKPAGSLVRGRSIGTCLLALFSNDDGENTVDLKIVYKIKFPKPTLRSILGVRFGLPRFTRKPQTNLLPCLTDLLPLADSNRDDQVHLRETDEFRRACVVQAGRTISTNFALREVRTAAYDERQTHLQLIVVVVDHGVLANGFQRQQK
jgi:hypothetical protein